MINAAIYDPQLLSSQGIKTVLENVDEISAVYLFNPELELSQQLSDYSTQLLVADFGGKSKMSLKTLQKAKEQVSDLKILIISDSKDPLQIKSYIDYGVDGFLTKDCSVEEVNTAIGLIKDGSRFYCQRIVDLLTDKDQNTVFDLSEREFEIIKLIALGKSSIEIADELHLSIHTINSHRKNILKKLGLKSPAELIIYAVEKGWVGLPN